MTRFDTSETGEQAGRDTHAGSKKPTPRRKDGKRAYVMDYIGDKTLYAAVMFARKMIREGRFPPKAIRIAANYHGVDSSDVAHYVAQAAGTSAGRRRR